MIEPESFWNVLVELRKTQYDGRIQNLLNNVQDLVTNSSQSLATLLCGIGYQDLH